MKSLYYEKRLLRRGGDDPAHDRTLRQIRSLFAMDPSSRTKEEQVLYEGLLRTVTAPTITPGPGDGSTPPWEASR